MHALEDTRLMAVLDTMSTDHCFIGKESLTIG